MIDESLALAAEFPIPDEAAWRELVDKALRGGDFGKNLKTPLSDGFSLDPLYTAENAPVGVIGWPGGYPFVRGTGIEGNVAGGWDIRQSVAVPDPKTANAVILEELERGATSVTLQFDDMIRGLLNAPPGANGIAAYTEADFAILLADIYLNMAAISLDAGENADRIAAVITQLAAQNGIAARDLNLAVNMDPLGRLAETGCLSEPVANAVAAVGDYAKALAQSHPCSTAIAVNTAPYYEAGASDAQDLACAMASGLTYLKAMVDVGMELDAGAAQIAFNYRLGTDFFGGICKLRAHRLLWARILEACGAAGAAGASRLHAGTALRHLSKRDPWVNILRATVTSMAAGLGGAQSLTCSTFDTPLGLPDTLGRRIARNTHILLIEESNIARVIDPAGGSWYLENRTRQLAEQAWNLFQEIEAAGGMATALQTGLVQNKIRATRTATANALASQEIPITGVSAFPDLDEAPVQNTDIDLPSALADAKTRLSAAGNEMILRAPTNTEGTQIDALPPYRFAAAFEELRDLSDRLVRDQGMRPKIFLANLGPVARHTARATYAKNFFAAGGIEAISNDGFEQAEDLAKAYTASGAKLAVICGSDDQYQQIGAAMADALKAAGCRRIYLAGRPETFAQIGADHVIYPGTDILQTCRNALINLGVLDP